MAFAGLSMRPMAKSSPPFDYYGDIFDQYVDAGVFDIGHDIANQSGSDELGNFFDFPDSLSGTDPTASPLQGSLYLGSCAKAASSEPDLLNLGDLFPSSTHLSGPSTTPNPSSPTSPTSKHALRNIAAKFRRSVSCGIRKHSRHYSLSPRMPKPQRSRQESWAERIDPSSQSNHPTSYSDITHATSECVGPSEWDHASSYNLQSSSGAAGWDVHPQYITHQPGFHATPIASPSFAHGHSQSISSVHSPSAYHTNHMSSGEASYSLTSPELERTTSWEYDHPAEYPFASPVFNDSTVQPWQPPIDPAQSYHSNYPGYTVPSGYGYSAEDVARYQPAGLPMYDSSGMPVAHESYAMASYPMSPTSEEHSRLSSMTSASERRRVQAQAHTKTESRHSRSPSPSPATPRSQKRDRGHRRGKASQGSSRTAPVDFVNYFPEDKKKILGGVAPSGSSKTKIKREKEAKERVKGIIAASGGDLSRLGAGDFVL